MRTALAALLLVVAPFALAAGFRKPYFGATKEGSWAKYAMHSVVPDNTFDYTYMYTRLPDQDGKARLELRTEFKGTPPTMNRVTLKKGFDVAHELIDYGAGIASGEMSSGEDDLQPMTEDVLTALARVASHYATRAKFVGTETVNGRSCDHYTYVTRAEGDPVQISAGDLWLDDSVPFGVVRQSETTKDPNGKFLSSYEETLLDSGTAK